MSYVRLTADQSTAMADQSGWEAMQEGWRKGPWTAQEDRLLVEHVRLHGEGGWNFVSKVTGLKRSGKSCRLRWVNYLRPDLKRGKITPYEESIIMELHSRWGNRWSAIARTLPGRTDNEIKNYWRTHFKKAKPPKNLHKARGAHPLGQQQQHKKPQEQPAEAQPADMASIVLPQLEEEVASLAQDVQDLPFPYRTPCMFQGAADGFLAGEASSDEGAWSCLWNLHAAARTAVAVPDACGNDTDTSVQDLPETFYELGFK